MKNWGGVWLLGLLSLAGGANAQQSDKNAERADRIRMLQRQVMDLESIARARFLQERGVKPVPRPAVKTRHNVETFAPVKARLIRFTVLATVNGAEPCLDSLEIFGPDSSANLTLGARMTASSIWPGPLGDFKGGIYSKGWCWVSQARGTGWVQAELPQAATIGRVIWSRDAGNRYHDRVPSVYRVEASEDGGTWQTVATGEDRAAVGTDMRLSRRRLFKALDASQWKNRLELMDELKKLGAPWPDEIKSGPQVGQGVPGGFRAQFLNGDHAGKACCPV
jgi:hypothetical protein